MGHGTSKLPYNAKQSHKTASNNLLRRNLISKPNNKEIYSLDRLLNIKLIIKFPMNKERIQCKKCQRYGYIQKYCTRTPRCMKYTEDHLSTERTKKIIDGNIKYIYQPYDTSVKTQQYGSEGLSCTSVIKQRTRDTTEEENVNEQMDNYMQHKNEEIAIMMRMMTEIKNLISEQTKQ
ncbi:LOW QUALITY PROTEIN: hypothetical protein V1477_003411, partial [Vespula maculifrons]